MSITVPVSADLGTGAAGGSTHALLGPVTVTDARGALVAAWTTTVTSTAFTTGGGTPAETVANSNICYLSGLATATSPWASSPPVSC
ncbi:MAG: hypothetical protein WCA46_12010 [Actinocatenispora sp.]